MLGVARDVAITLAVFATWSWILFMAGYLNGLQQRRDETNDQVKAGMINGTGTRSGHAALAGDRIGRDRPGAATVVRAVRG